MARAEMGRLPHRLMLWIAEQALLERDRWPLLLPVGLAAGIGIYFGLPAEPAPWVGAISAGLALAAFMSFRRAAWPAGLALAALIVSLGFAAAQFHASTASPLLGVDRAGPGTVEGRVVAVETRAAGVRLLLDRLVIEDVGPDQTPERIRLVAQGWKTGQPQPGDLVRLFAMVRPPPAPAAPGAYDFAREAYFEGLGGVGFVYGAGEVIGHAPIAGAWSLHMARLRHDIAVRVQAALPAPIGAMAVALITGERTAIPESVNEAMRDSGLFHLLSISGLHLSLIAGLLFFAVRAAVALVEPIALRWQSKKIAALAALVGAGLYLLLSGAAVPTQRAFLMTGLALVAVILDRSPFSMRLIAFAGGVVLIMAPHSLLGASFQLSFAAVVALIAVWEVIGDRGLLVRRRSDHPMFGFGLYLGGLLLTSVVAGVATAPATVFHFNRLAIYGVAANLIAVPVTGFVIMPAALAALALMPLGLEAWPLWAMGQGLGLVLDVADTVAAWPAAVVAIPEISFAAYLAMTLGGLWLCLWRRAWRWGGLALVVAGIAFGATGDGPDILIDGGGRIVAVRGADGDLAISDTRGSRMVRESWLRRTGQRAWSPWPSMGEHQPWLACDSLGCIYRRDGIVVALVVDARAVDEDCRVADVLVATVPVGRRCAAPVVIDRFDLWRFGAHALWIAAGDIRVVSVAETRGRRPWVVAPESARKTAETAPRDGPEL